MSIGQKYQQTRNVLRSDEKLISNEKFSLNLVAPKFQKRSFQKIFSAKSFKETFGEIKF